MNDIVIIIAALIAVFLVNIFVLIKYTNHQFKLIVEDFNSRFPESFDFAEAAKFNEAVVLYTKENDRRSEALQNAVNSVNEQLEALIKIQSAGEGIVWDSVRESLNEYTKGLESARSGLLTAGNTLRDSVDNYVKSLNNNNVDVNLINKLLSLIQELNNNFTNYKSGELDTALEHMKNITEKIETSIGGTFTTVQKLLETSTENLKISYEQFYTACNKLYDFLEGNFTKKEVEKYLLGSFNNKLNDKEYTIDEIQKLILNRTIQSRNYTICKSGTDNWQPITSVQSLKNAFDTVEGKA